MAVITPKNLAEQLNTIGGVGRIWMLPLDVWKTEGTDAPTVLEKLTKPATNNEEIASNVIFDLLGKVTMDSVSDNGEDISRTDIRSTDGAIIKSVVMDGTYGISFSSANFSKDICKELLNMKEVTTSGVTGLGKGAMVYGNDDKMGFINPAAIFVEVLDSDLYSGILFPYASITSKLVVGGNKTDIWTINIQITAQDCPLKYDGKVLTSEFGGAAYALIAK